MTTSKWASISSMINKIKFNDYNFSDIIISNIPDDFDWSSIDVQTYDLTTHGQGLANWLIKDKTLTINGRIIAKDEEDLERKINRVKANLMQNEWTLYIERKIWILKTKASISWISIPRNSRTINTVEITIVFKILDPFLYSEELSEIAIYGVDKRLYKTVQYSEGSQATKPSISISFNSASSVDKILIQINKKFIQINHSINPGDIIDINASKLDVWINWKYWVDWIGEFGELEFWNNEVVIDIDWKFSADIYIKYYNTYV